METALSDEQSFLREAVEGAIQRHAPIDAIRRWAFEGEGKDPGLLAIDQSWEAIGIGDELGGQGGGMIERMIVAGEMGSACLPDGHQVAASLAYRAAMLARRSDLVTGWIEQESTPGLIFDTGRALDDQARADGPFSLDFVNGAALRSESVLFLRAAEGSAVELALLSADELETSARTVLDRTRPLVRVNGPCEGAETLGRLSQQDLERLTAELAVLNAADSLGAARWALKETVAYVKDRRQFGAPVGSFQAVKHAAAEMLVKAEAASAAIDYAAWALDEPGEPDFTHAWLARAYAADNLVPVADMALFLHGAIGYTWEHDLHLRFKRIKHNAAAGGSAASYHDRVATLAGLDPSLG